MKYNSVRGMEDMLPQDSWLWHYIEKKFRDIAAHSGYSEIRTPILEETGVFTRSVGEATDIVSKEMYTFQDRKGRSLTMRPEGTAPIVRSCVEHAFLNNSPIARLYYSGPMFRAERPQKGRLRQFHQIGLEIIGSLSPFADIEAIILAYRLLKSLGLKDFTIKINTLGCKADKASFSAALKEYLSGKMDKLCDDCRSRIGKNVIRVLDCKNEACRMIMAGAPGLQDSVCRKCGDDFKKIRSVLLDMGIETYETSNLVRGLDYYTGTVFEITSSSLGSQDAIGAGGRYDSLVKDMGGPDAGAVGFALGMERMIIALKENGCAKDKDNVLFIATLGDNAKVAGIKIAEDLKSLTDIPGLVILTDIGEGSLKSQMRCADKNGAKLVVILGDDELKVNRATIKDMRPDGLQSVVDVKYIVNEVRKILC